MAEKQLRLIEREKELLDKDQTVSTLREEVRVFSNQLQQFGIWWLAAKLFY